MSLKDFLVGQPRYVREAASGHAVAAVLATGLIMLAGQFAGAAGWKLISLVGPLPAMLPPIAAGGAPHAASQLPSTSDLMLMALISQAVIVALTLAIAKARHNLAALKLAAPDGGPRTYLYALLAMMPLIVMINVAAYTAAPKLFAQDFAAFRELARAGGLLPTALAIGVGAPLSEELLFRGFLLSALAATALGYWPAALLATAGWTLLHVNYSWVGLAEVFAIGLYFSWLLWRTGSLLPALVCHAVYNSCLLIGLRYWWT